MRVSVGGTAPELEAARQAIINHIPAVRASCARTCVCRYLLRADVCVYLHQSCVSQLRVITLPRQRFVISLARVCERLMRILPAYASLTQHLLHLPVLDVFGIPLRCVCGRACL